MSGGEYYEDELEVPRKQTTKKVTKSRKGRTSGEDHESRIGEEIEN
jgi:hypothetical protein